MTLETGLLITISAVLVCFLYIMQQKQTKDMHQVIASMPTPPPETPSRQSHELLERIESLERRMAKLQDEALAMMARAKTRDQRADQKLKKLGEDDDYEPDPEEQAAAHAEVFGKPAEPDAVDPNGRVGPILLKGRS